LTTTDQDPVRPASCRPQHKEDGVNSETSVGLACVGVFFGLLAILGIDALVAQGLHWLFPHFWGFWRDFVGVIIAVFFLNHLRARSVKC